MPIEWALYPLLGAAAGVLAGLLGVGGGLILVAALAWLLPSQGVPPALAMHAALATSLASIVITAAASSWAHHRRGSVLWPAVAWLVPGIVVGGWLGSGFAAHLSGTALRAMVAGYCWLAALQLVIDRTPAATSEYATPRGIGLTLAGAAIGAVSAVVGIGGGSMTVPWLVWRGVPPVRAVGTSSACGVAIGLASASGYAVHASAPGMPPGSVGPVFLPAAIGIAAASMLAARWGVRLAHRLDGAVLKRVFAGFLAIVGTALALT